MGMLDLERECRCQVKNVRARNYVQTEVSVLHKFFKNLKIFYILQVLAKGMVELAHLMKGGGPAFIFGSNLPIFWVHALLGFETPTIKSN